MAGSACALERLDDFVGEVGERAIVLLLDFDAIGEDRLALLRKTIEALARRWIVAILGDWNLDELWNRVRVECAFYAGRDGLEVAGPKGWVREARAPSDLASVLETATVAVLDPTDGHEARGEIRFAVRPSGHHFGRRTGGAVKSSARNQFRGTVKSVEHGAVNSEVTIELSSEIEIVAIITRSSARRLELVPGREAYAIVKASDVMVGIA